LAQKPDVVENSGLRSIQKSIYIATHEGSRLASQLHYKTSDQPEGKEISKIIFFDLLDT
jgi:hypothetical protein